MSRLTGADAYGLMEAYSQVYTPDSVYIAAELWVSACIEEGVDFSQYTLDEITEGFIIDMNSEDLSESLLSEILGMPGAQNLGANVRQQFGKARRAVGGAIGNVAKGYADVAGAYGQGFAGQKTTSKNPLARAYNAASRFMSAPGRATTSFGAGLVSGKPASKPGASPAPAKPAAPTSATAKPAPAGQTVAAAGGKGGTVTVGRQYAATQGGVKGNVTYDAAGKKTFAADKPAAAKPGTTPTAAKPGTPPAPAAKPVPAAAAKPAPTAPAAPARPSLRSGLDDIRRMQQASQMRQKGIAITSDQIKDAQRTKPTTPSLGQKASGLSLGSSQFKPTTPSAKPTTPAAPAGPPRSGAAAAPGFRAPALGPKPTPAPGPKPTTPTPVAATPPKPAGNPPKKPVVAHFDLFDVIKGHLLDEGYADNEDAALAIMANMSEEWKQSILEG